METLKSMLEKLTNFQESAEYFTEFLLVAQEPKKAQEH